MKFQRLDSHFKSQGIDCAAWLFLPEVENPPCIVMAHGFGAERSWKLPDYASHFASNGIAVLCFDYRNFGASQGEPRNYVSPERHIEDYRAAISHLQRTPEVDASRIGLWGASFSGGHSLVTAARDHRVKATAVLVPFLDALASLDLVNPLQMAGGVGLSLIDIGASLLQQEISIPIVGKPGDMAFLTFKGWYEEVINNLPENTTWQNKMPARSIIEIASYRPISEVANIKCPVQVIYGSKDRGIKPSLVEDAIEKIKQVETECWPMNHFGPFSGDFVGQTMKKQTEFYLKHL